MRRRKLTADRRKDAFHLGPEPKKNRDRYDGNESQDQRVLDQGLAFSGSLLAAVLFVGIHIMAQLLFQFRPSLAPKEDPF
jgi:hypothetical protein